VSQDKLRHFLEKVRQQAALQQLRDLPDSELLARFVAHQYATAFAALLHRHCPMVMVMMTLPGRAKRVR
jgi:hypothetical protein